MNGPILAALTQSFLDAINAGAVPTIATSWQVIMEIKPFQFSIYISSLATEKEIELDTLCFHHFYNSMIQGIKTSLPVIFDTSFVLLGLQHRIPYDYPINASTYREIVKVALFWLMIKLFYAP